MKKLIVLAVLVGMVGYVGIAGAAGEKCTVISNDDGKVVLDCGAAAGEMKKGDKVMVKAAKKGLEGC